MFKVNVRMIFSFISVMVFFVLSSVSYAQSYYYDNLRSTVKGEAVNGWNKRMGEPVADLRFVGDLTFDVGGVCGTDKAGPVTSDTPLDALLCSYAAPAVYQAFFGVQVTEDTPNLNIPYADYPQLISHDSQQGPLPQTSTVPWYKKSNGAQVEGYTVYDWLKARGKINFSCNDYENYYQVIAKNLVPGGLYTVWGFYFDQVNPPRPQGTGGLQSDFAFGGTSANVFVADKDGKVRGKRSLNFCPLTWPRDEQFQLVNLFLVYHPDGRVNASVGHTVATEPFVGPGVTATPQIMFAIPEQFNLKYNYFQ